MGIRFACHHCNFSLHVKDFQGGKRGRCPECKGPFRIPNQDASHSIELLENGQKVLDLSEAGTLSLETDALQEKAITSKSGSQSSTSTTAAAAIKGPQSELPRMPRALADSPGAKWFVKPPTGGQFGPATSQLLMDWIVERRVTADSLLWKEGTPDWALAIQLLPELYPDEELNKVVPELESSGMKGANFGLADSSGNEEQQVATSSGLLLAKKRARKRKQQLTIVTLLGLASLALLGTLITVLVMQMNKA